jgi:hypothetical protein
MTNNTYSSDISSPIFVTGVLRSGSSMIAGVLNKCGAFGGNMAVLKSNERGMYENIRIRDTIIKPYLLRMGADADGQYPLPENLDIPENWKKEVENIIKSEGYQSGAWMYKDSRIALTWKIWHYAFPNAKWVIVRRRTGDIIQSCVKTGFMKAFKNEDNRLSIKASTEEEGWLWLVHEYEKRFVEMMTEGVNCKIIWPERMVYGDYKQLYELMDWLRLSWTPEIFDYIDPLLETSRKKEREVNHGSIGK